MSGKRILLAIVLADFVAFTAYAVFTYGYSAFFPLFLSNAIGLQVFADLVISLSLISAWVISDARSRGVSPLPYLGLTLVLGSIGPLLYLVMRPDEATAREPALAAATTR